MLNNYIDYFHYSIAESCIYDYIFVLIIGAEMKYRENSLQYLTL